MATRKTSREVADDIGCSPSTVSRWAVRMGLGRMIHNVREFTAREVEALRKCIRPGTPGNPLMGPEQPGNYGRTQRKS